MFCINSHMLQQLMLTTGVLTLDSLRSENEYVLFCFCPLAGVLSPDTVLLWKAAVHYSPRCCLLQLSEQVWRETSRGRQLDWCLNGTLKQEGVIDGIHCKRLKQRNYILNCIPFPIFSCEVINV